METLKHTEQAAISKRLELPDYIVKRLCFYSRKLHRLYETSANGSDRDKLPQESWEHYQAYSQKCLELNEKQEAKLWLAVEKLTAANQLYVYHQTDCRGIALYISRTALNDANYDRDGIALY